MIDRNQQNQNKQRKSESEEIFEEAENAGRFAGDDADAKVAKEQALERIRLDKENTSHPRNVFEEDEHIRGKGQRTDKKGEAQNVQDDKGRPMSDKEAQKAANKALEGQRQRRDEGPSTSNAERMNDRKS